MIIDTTIGSSIGPRNYPRRRSVPLIIVSRTITVPIDYVPPVLRKLRFPSLSLSLSSFDPNLNTICKWQDWATWGSLGCNHRNHTRLSRITFKNCTLWTLAGDYCDVDAVLSRDFILQFSVTAKLETSGLNHRSWVFGTVITRSWSF